jgi:hypothetical protein
MFLILGAVQVKLRCLWEEVVVVVVVVVVVGVVECSRLKLNLLRWLML